MKDNWFKLLNKFYNGVEVTIMPNTHGTLSYEWLCENTINITDIIEIKTDSIFNQIEISNILPSIDNITINVIQQDLVEPTPEDMPKINTIYDNIVRNIKLEELENVEKKYDSDGNEIRELSMGPFYDICERIKITSCDKKYVPYIIHKLCQHTNLKGVYKLDSDKWVVSLKKSCAVYLITNTYIEWIYFPVFDVDDGFCTRSILSEKLNNMFKVWRNKFDETFGASWDEQVLHN
jgi:hypothetical protein